MKKIGCLISMWAALSSGQYAIEVGEADQERITIVNEIYNPFSLDFIDQCGIEGKKVLEIGCGIGTMSREIAQRASEVVATDISSEQLRIAESVNEDIDNLRFAQASAFELSALGETFDVVYVRFVLCHLENPARAFAEARKVLRPGGLLIVEDIAGFYTPYTVPHTEGMQIEYDLAKIQIGIQKSQHDIALSFPTLYKEAQMELIKHNRVHPRLDSIRHRSLFLLNLFAIEKAIVASGQVTQEEYQSYVPVMQSMVDDLSTQVFSYEFVQYCGTI